MSLWVRTLLDELEDPHRVRCTYCWAGKREDLREDEGGHLFCSAECEDEWRHDKLDNWVEPLIGRAFRKGN